MALVDDDAIQRLPIREPAGVREEPLYASGLRRDDDEWRRLGRGRRPYQVPDARPTEAYQHVAAEGYRRKDKDGRPCVTQRSTRHYEQRLAGPGGEDKDDLLGRPSAQHGEHPVSLAWHAKLEDGVVVERTGDREEGGLVVGRPRPEPRLLTRGEQERRRARVRPRPLYPPPRSLSTPRPCSYGGARRLSMANRFRQLSEAR